MIEFVARSPHLQNLYLIQYGMEACTPGHQFGPSTREYYKIHYIIDGEGVFEYGGRTYSLKKGDGFLLCPGEVAFYKADLDRPWHYCWIGFNGNAAQALLLEAALSNEHPVFSLDEDIPARYVQMMIETDSSEPGRNLYLNGLLQMYFGALTQHRAEARSNIEPHTGKVNYVQQVIDFIELNYDSKITIEGIARTIGLQRNYLGHLFKEHTNLSIQSFLIQYRMNKACEWLQQDNLSIGDAARSVGYHDPLLFSKTFKKTFGISPTEYRKQLTYTK
ncbi:AraC family transcriptional regulator [Neobacillus mesonae]|nr:AraC family transcriptional regulator [Neobacillus mesonae]